MPAAPRTDTRTVRGRLGGGRLGGGGLGRGGLGGRRLGSDRPAGLRLGGGWGVLLWLVLVCAATALVQGHALGRLPLWRDEIASVELASRPLPALLTALGRIDVVHGLHDLLLHVVLGFERSEVVLRLPSLVGSVAAVGLTAELARRRLGLVPACVVAVLLIANPFLGFYAEEARGYSLATALVCGAAFALLGGRRPRPGWFVVLAVLATYAHLFDGLTVAGLFAGWVAATRPGLRTVLGCVAGWAAGVAPLVVVAARQVGQVSWVGVPTLDDVRVLAAGVAGTGATAVAIGVLLLLAAARGRGSTVLVCAGAAALAGPAVLLTLSWLGHPLYVERYVLASVPMLALAVGAAVALVPAPRLVAAALVLVALTGLPAAWRGPASKTEDLRAAAAYLDATARPGDCVAYAPGWARLGVTYYLPYYLRGSLRDVALDPVPPAGLFADEVPQDRVVAHLRACDWVWVAGYPGPVGAWRPVPEVTTGALAVVGPEFTAGAPARFGDMTVTLWMSGQPPSARGVRSGNSSG